VILPFKAGDCADTNSCAGNELELQRGAASKAESEDGNDAGSNRDHAHNGMAVAQKSLAFLGLSEF
jgi:hypothetical protein